MIQNRIDIGQAPRPSRLIRRGDHHVLEGSLEYHLDGQEPTRLSAGDVLLVPAETVHAVRNLGGGNASELATYFVEKDKPFLVVVE